MWTHMMFVVVSVIRQSHEYVMGHSMMSDGGFSPPVYGLMSNSLNIY